MAYIYKITNDINDKIYIGLTKFNINKRFKEHCCNAQSGKATTRPLILAMRTYGVDHFKISLIEETDRPAEREKYWITYYGSNVFGYNATVGGEGSTSEVDDDEIVMTYLEVGTIVKTAQIFQVSEEKVRLLLHSRNVDVHSMLKDAEIKYQRRVCMYALSNTKNPIATFNSMYDAMEYLVSLSKTEASRICDVCSNITRVCDGERKSAYGYYWQYEDVVPQMDSVVNVVQYAIEQYDMNGNFIQGFPSSAAAARYLIECGDRSNVKALTVQIRDVIKNKRKTCRGYIWRAVA